MNVTGIEYETLNTTLNLHTYSKIPELLFVKNAGKHFFDKGYGTAISDKIDKKFTPLPRPPPPLLPNSMGKWRVLAQFRAASSLILGEGGQGWWFAGHFILSKVLALAPIYSRGPSGVRAAV